MRHKDFCPKCGRRRKTMLDTGIIHPRGDRGEDYCPHCGKRLFIPGVHRA